MRTFVYIDGFNLYYGALRNTPYKWLDVKKLVNNYFKTAKIHKIKYFTARITSRPDDISQPTRQDVYLRALKTIPEIEIIEGNFQSKSKLLPTTKNYRKYVSVYVTEEKGSDVNLAVHMLNDAHRNYFDQAILVSNDSDLSESVRLTKEIGKRVIILNPYGTNSTNKLKIHAAFCKPIRMGAIKDSQFQNELTDSLNSLEIHKPEDWNKLSLIGSCKEIKSKKWRVNLPKLGYDAIGPNKKSTIAGLRRWIFNEHKTPKAKFHINSDEYGRLKVVFIDWEGIIHLLKK